MVYASDRDQLSTIELAQGGHLPSMAYWLNRRLSPYRLRARLSWIRPGQLRVVVELHPARTDVRSQTFRNRLVRFVCHQLWILNSDVLDGAYVAARYTGQPKILWRQSVRIVSPARKAVLAQSAQQLHTRIRQAKQQKKQFQVLRSLMISGSSAAAFIIGCWLGYADAPADQTSASAWVTTPGITASQSSSMVTTPMGEVPVLKPSPRNSDPAVSLLFGGDVALTENYSAKVGNDHQWTFAPFDEARRADVSMVNLESPLTNASQGLPGKRLNFKSAPDNVQVLKNGGIDLVNLANDHAMDYQGAGLEDTIKALDGAGVAHVGAGRNSQEARRPVIVDVKGQRIAYLGYYDADLHAASDQAPGTNPRHNDRIAADIKALRNQVNWIIVNYHWGEDLAKYPGDWQIDLAHYTIDQGADMVVGYHPNVLQGAEVYKGRPIIYSLGNFIFGGKTGSDYDTAALQVSLKDHQMKVEFVPVQVRNYQAKAVSGEAGQQVLQQIANVSDIFQQPLTAPMVMDAQTNKVISVAAPKPSPAEHPAKTTPADSPSAQPEISPKKPVEESHPDNPWNPDSFINNSGSDAGSHSEPVKPMVAPNPQGASPRATRPAVAQDPTGQMLEANSSSWVASQPAASTGNRSVTQAASGAVQQPNATHPVNASSSSETIAETPAQPAAQPAPSAPTPTATDATGNATDGSVSQASIAQPRTVPDDRHP